MSSPTVRFPEFGEPWRITTLGDEAKFSKGRGISKSDIVDGGAIPCIRYGQLYTDYGTVIDNVISATNVDPAALRLSMGGEVIVPASGEDAKDIATAAVVLHAGVALGGDLNIITTEHDGSFLASYLSGKKRPALAVLAQGNSVVHLYPRQLSGVELAMPSLPEQRRIADALSVVDAKIDQLGRKRDALTRFKAGLMQKLFSQEMRFTRGDGSAYPDWEEKELGELLSYQQPTPYLVKSSDYQAGALTPVLTAGKTFILGYTNEDWGIYDALPVIIFDDFTTDSRYVDFPFKAKSSAMKMLTVRNPDDSCRVIHEAMRQIDYEPSGHKRHWISEYQHLTIMLPSPEEQAQLEDALASISARIDAMSRQIATIQAFKKGLLQQMFV